MQTYLERVAVVFMQVFIQVAVIIVLMAIQMMDVHAEKMFKFIGKKGS
jgi:hypothetical protein